MAILGMGNNQSIGVQDDIANVETSYPIETKETTKIGTPKKEGNMLNAALAEIATLKSKKSGSNDPKDKALGVLAGV